MPVHEFDSANVSTDRLAVSHRWKHVGVTGNNHCHLELVRPRHHVDGQRRVEPLVSAERPATNPTLDTIERAYILWVLQSEGGNKTRAAEVLGIDPSTLHRKLARFGVDA